MKIDKALEAMKKSIIVKEDKPIEKPKRGRPKVITEKKREEILRAAEEVFFVQSIAAKVGVYRERISQLVREDKAFASSLLHARDKWIAQKQALLEEYAKDKKTSDWRALKYLLTIADRDYSERKYLTEAVANQDAKIMMLIKAEQLTIASKQGKKMLEKVINADVQGQEEINLLPFKPEDPKNKGKAKTVKNKGESTHPPSVE